jgi:hypothetical protein
MLSDTSKQRRNMSPWPRKGILPPDETLQVAGAILKRWIDCWCDERNSLGNSENEADLGLFYKRVSCFDLATESPTGCEGTGDVGPDWMARFDDIVQDSVDGIFVEDAKIPVGVDVHFERFQLKTFFIRHVVQRNGSKVRQVGFRTNRCVLGDLNCNFISLVLIREGLDVRQRYRNAALCVPLVVA